MPFVPLADRVNDRVSYPVMTLPVIPPKKSPTASSQPTVKRGRIRLKGTLQPSRSEVELTPFQRFLRDATQALLVLVDVRQPTSGHQRRKPFFLWSIFAPLETTI
ncbi:hypothetical protein CCP3SC5AM1_1250009 [Gammaproteobacteria bacterium]